MDSLGKEKELVQNKLILLYILKKLDVAVTNRQLTKLILSHRLMNYFIMQQMLLELISSKYVDAQVDENKEQIQLSELGEKTLEYFKNLIPGYIKLKIDTKILPDKPAKKFVKTKKAEYYPVGINKYKTTLEYGSETDDTIKISISTDKHDIAKSIVKNWNENSEELYNRIMEILKE